MKKFMKGLLATTMVFAMMTSLAGCGGDAATDDSAGNTYYGNKRNIPSV